MSGAHVGKRIIGFAFALKGDGRHVLGVAQPFHRALGAPAEVIIRLLIELANRRVVIVLGWTTAHPHAVVDKAVCLHRAEQPRNRTVLVTYAHASKPSLKSQRVVPPFESTVARV